MNPPRSMWVVWVVALSTILAAAGALLWAQSGPQPAYGLFSASPPNFVFNVPTTVTFSVLIDTPTLNPIAVELQRVDATGNILAIVGRMYDDGRNGDRRPGDKTFTARAILNESSIGKIYFRVAAAFGSNRHNAWSQPLALDVDPFPLPPDPGEAGKQTLEGIDADRDGIRDDVQRYIALRHVSSARARAALNQYAGVAQLVVTSPPDSPQLQNIDLLRRQANDCIEYVLGASTGASEASAISIATLNTSLRVRAYGHVERSIHVEPYYLTNEAHLKTGCAFDPDSLPTEA